MKVEIFNYQNNAHSTIDLDTFLAQQVADTLRYYPDNTPDELKLVMESRILGNLLLKDGYYEIWPVGYKIIYS